MNTVCINIGTNIDLSISIPFTRLKRYRVSTIQIKLSKHNNKLNIFSRFQLSRPERSIQDQRKDFTKIIQTPNLYVVLPTRTS